MKLKQFINIGFVLSIVSLLVLFYSCKKDITKSAEYLEVMKIHDVAMAEMGNIHKRTKELKSFLIEAKTNEDSMLIITSLDDLEKAEDGMMEWMANFQLPKSHNEAILFLQKEKIKVETVNMDIFNALETADSIVTSQQTVQ